MEAAAANSSGGEVLYSTCAVQGHGYTGAGEGRRKPSTCTRPACKMCKMCCMRACQHTDMKGKQADMEGGYHVSQHVSTGTSASPVEVPVLTRVMSALDVSRGLCWPRVVYNACACGLLDHAADLQAEMAILDEIDSGLDIDALRDVATAVNGLKTPERSVLMVTHYRVSEEHHGILQPTSQGEVRTV